METITITVADDRLSKLKEIALDLNLTVEELTLNEPTLVNGVLEPVNIKVLLSKVVVAKLVTSILGIVELTEPAEAG